MEAIDKEDFLNACQVFHQFDLSDIWRKGSSQVHNQKPFLYLKQHVCATLIDPLGLKLIRQKHSTGGHKTVRQDLTTLERHHFILCLDDCSRNMSLTSLSYLPRMQACTNLPCLLEGFDCFAAKLTSQFKLFWPHEDVFYCQRSVLGPPLCRCIGLPVMNQRSVFLKQC